MWYVVFRGMHRIPNVFEVQFFSMENIFLNSFLNYYVKFEQPYFMQTAYLIFNNEA